MKTNLFKKRTGISSLLLVGLLVVSTEFFAQTVTYTVAGTQTWICPAGVSSVSVQCWGGGGGSGGASNILNSAGGGGGGGAYAYSVINVTPGTTYTINVGAGGAGGASTGGSGLTGGGSKFDTSSVSAVGGSGGWSSTSGIGGAGGLGGSSTSCVGTILYSGGSGATGVPAISGGGGGGSAGSNGSGGNTINGSGGTTPTGGGGAVGATALLTTSTSGGVAGFSPGGGAAGASISFGGNFSGAAGGDGQVILTYMACATNPTITVTATATVVCEGTSITLTASGANTYTWTGAVNNGVAFTPPAPLAASVTYTYSVTGTDAIGCTNTVAQLITVNALPVISVNSATICNGQSATLTAFGATTYTWSTGIVASSITVFPTTTTVYTVTGTTAGCSNTQTTSVIVNSPPTITVISSPTSMCVGSTATLSATSSSAGGTTYTWNPGSAQGSSVAVTPTTTTTYTVTGTAAGCTASQTINLIVTPAPTTTISSIATTCNGFCDGKGSVVASGGTGFTYSWSPASTSTISVATGLCPGTYMCVVTNNCGLSHTDTLFINQPPALTAQISVVGAPVCIGNTATLTSVAGGGTPGYSVIWSDASTATSIVVTPTVMPTTSYTVNVTDANGCTASSVVSLTVLPLPIITVAASHTTLCEGDSTKLAVSVGGGSPHTYLWCTGDTVSNITVTPANLPTTDYTINVKDLNGCIATQTLSIIVDSVPSITVTPVNATMCAGDTNTINLSGAFNYTTNPGGITLSSFTVALSSSTTYSVTGIATNGCTNGVTFNVDVSQNCALIVYNAFSPNNDGLNDYFFIGNIDHFSNNKVFIYNRWGNKLFETTNYNNINNAWNGKLNGVTVPNGTYFYVINFNDGKDFIKSWVEVTN